MKMRVIAYLAGCLALTLAQSAIAEEEAPNWKFGGFGTAGASYHHADGLEYHRSTDQKEGARSGKTTTELDSVLGLQLSGHATNQIDGMVQTVSRQYADGYWDPRVTWAFLRYSPNDDWQLRAGRLGLDTQLYADSRTIGYAFLTVRPQPELFGGLPFDYLDGFDIRYRHPFGDGDYLLTLKAFRGRLDGEVANPSGVAPIKYGKIRFTGLVATVAHDDLQFRAVYARAHIVSNGDSQPLLDGLRATGFASASAAADKLDNSGHSTNAAELAFLYDGNPLSVEAAILHNSAPRSSAVLARTTSFALLTGYRIGSFKPYLGFAHTTSSSSTVSSGLPAFGPLIALDQAVADVSATSQRRQQTWTLGVRYDFANNMDLKLQLDGIRAKRSALVTETANPSDRYRGMALFTATVDFVF